MTNIEKLIEVATEWNKEDGLNIDIELLKKDIAAFDTADEEFGARTCTLKNPFTEIEAEVPSVIYSIVNWLYSLNDLIFTGTFPPKLIPTFNNFRYIVEAFDSNIYYDFVD